MDLKCVFNLHLQPLHCHWFRALIFSHQAHFSFMITTRQLLRAFKELIRKCLFRFLLIVVLILRKALPTAFFTTSTICSRLLMICGFLMKVHAYGISLQPLFYFHRMGQTYCNYNLFIWYKIQKNSALSAEESHQWNASIRVAHAKLTFTRWS